MKKFNLLSAVLAFFLLVSVNAQNDTDKWYISVGAHAVDYTSVRPMFGGYFDFDDYSIVPPLSKLVVSRTLSKKFAVDMEASFGQVDDKRLEINDEFYALAGLGIRYYALQKKWGDFFLRTGANYHRYEYENVTFPFYGSGSSSSDGEYAGLEQPTDPQNNNFAVTFGAGFNFWFTKNFGLNVESNYVWLPAFEQDYFNHFQHSLGLAFRFGNRDRDGDGIMDKEDECPEVPGIAECNGCPDTDEDGICDKQDECVEEAGVAACQGCPDTDGDGVCDKNDDCVDEAGPADNNGCPLADRDKDGVPDRDDACLDTFGKPNSDPKLNGCPEIEKPDVTKEVVDELRTLAREVYFEFNKDVLREDSKSKLDRAAYLMNNDFKDYNFLVEGHTDSKGSDAYNLNLSQKRAESVVNYLASKGVSASRLKAIGYGETIPQQTNETDAGRAMNRRVEVKPADASFNPTALILSSAEADQEIADLAQFIFFVTGKSQLQPSSRAQLNLIAQYLKQYPSTTWEVQGHTDNTGNADANMKLSQSRAQAVVDYLVGQGISKSQLTAKGYGQTQPAVSNDTADGRSQNRRVEFKRTN